MQMPIASRVKRGKEGLHLVTGVEWLGRIKEWKPKQEFLGYRDMLGSTRLPRSFLVGCITSTLALTLTPSLGVIARPYLEAAASMYIRGCN